MKRDHLFPPSKRQSTNGERVGALLVHQDVDGMFCVRSDEWPSIFAHGKTIADAVIAFGEDLVG